MQKSVLITGAAVRIGRTLALGLAKDGWRVAIHYNRSQGRAQKLAQHIEADGGAAVIVNANLNVPDQRNTLIARTITKLGTPLHALINNASTFAPDLAGDFTACGFDHHFDANLKAPLRLSQDFTGQLPGGQDGVIINMIDQRVLKTKADYFTYSLSKSALLTATQTMALAFAPHIRVCAIGPGPSLKNIHQSEAEFKADVDKTPLKTGSPPREILQAVRYLLAAKTVTGQMIAVDGGEHLR